MPRLAVFGMGLLTAAKLGSGLNHFLSLRVVEAMAIGAIWGASAIPRDRSLVSLAAVLLSRPCRSCRARSCRCGTLRSGWTRDLRHTEGQRFLGGAAPVLPAGEDPNGPAADDSGLLQLHQKERAPSSTRSSSTTWSTPGRSTPT